MHPIAVIGKKISHPMLVLVLSTILFVPLSQAKTLINKNLGFDPMLAGNFAPSPKNFVVGSIDKCLVTERNISSDGAWLLFSCRDLEDASQTVYHFRRLYNNDGKYLGAGVYKNVYADPIKVNQIRSFNFGIEFGFKARINGVPRDRLSTDFVYTVAEPVGLLGNLDEYNKKPRKLSLSDRLESGMGKDISAITKVLKKLPTATYELPQGNKLYRWVNRYSDYDKNIYLDCNQEFYTNNENSIIGWYHDCPEDIFQGNAVPGNTPLPKPKPVELSAEALESRVKPTY